ncbi:hypothetical protein RMAECT_0853 [Rickettsia rhipicephali str. Ect]|uniref:Uncharacterized protein n=1 Tax=Rickettsia rhipicephali str. Ect TaxID=1359199 RepID=A0A0F3PFE7_RICRH|nr:hypothetical protein RMAECT_0853 [Rickettsia rhipicephali str. Ect]
MLVIYSNPLKAIITTTTIARPPPRGVILSWERRLLGISTKPIVGRYLVNIYVNIAVDIKEKINNVL